MPKRERRYSPDVALIPEVTTFFYGCFCLFAVPGSRAHLPLSCIPSRRSSGHLVLAMVFSRIMASGHSPLQSSPLPQSSPLLSQWPTAQVEIPYLILIVHNLLHHVSASKRCSPQGGQTLANTIHSLQLQLLLHVSALIYSFDMAKISGNPDALTYLRPAL